jgi:hypothetical protein
MEQPAYVQQPVYTTPMFDPSLYAQPVQQVCLFVLSSPFYPSILPLSLFPFVSFASSSSLILSRLIPICNKLTPLLCPNSKDFNNNNSSNKRKYYNPKPTQFFNKVTPLPPSLLSSLSLIPKN